MKSEELDNIGVLFETLSMEAKEAFIKKFAYLRIRPPNINADKILRNVPNTDGNILVELTCSVVIPFSILEIVLLDKYIAPFNYRLDTTYTHSRTKVFLKRFYYNTKDKTIFGM